MSTSTQGPPSAMPPGWYADPWAPGFMRWWSGRDWTAYTMPAYAPAAMRPSRPTDGFAVVSLVTSVLGLSPLGIVFGWIAKRRIRKADGARDGGGLATAGIAIGCVMLTLTGIVVTLALIGVFDEVNRDDYTGDDAEVAQVIDRFEEAYENSDGAHICHRLFTAELAAEYASDGGCETFWSEGEPGSAEIDIYELYLAGDGATVMADEEDARHDWTFYLDRYPGGGWLISGTE